MIGFFSWKNSQAELKWEKDFEIIPCTTMGMPIAS